MFIADTFIEDQIPSRRRRRERAFNSGEGSTDRVEVEVAERKGEPDQPNFRKLGSIASLQTSENVSQNPAFAGEL